MNADRFSLRARRTTRIPLRIPVVIVIEEGGQHRSQEAWTMIVNVHGAKIECPRRFGMQEAVTIQVPFNGRSQTGKVVWSKSERNESGNYEFGVELDQPENLWGVMFPPSDWDASRTPKTAEATAAILELAPVETGVSAGAGDSGNAHPHAVAGDDVMPDEGGTAKQIIYTSAPEQLGQLLDLSEELSAFRDLPPDTAPEPGSGPQCSPATSAMEECGLMPHEENPPEPVAGQAENGTQPNGGTPPAEPFVAAPVVRVPEEVPAGLSGATDRFSAFLHELAATVLQDSVRRIIGTVEEHIAMRLAEMEAAGVRSAEQLRNAAIQHGDALERQAQASLAAARHTLEEGVGTCLTQAEAALENRHEELVEQGRQTLSARIGDLALSHAERLERQASDLLSTTRQAMRSSLEQQLPELERDILERCRKAGDQMMAAQVEQWTLLFSDRVRDAEQSVRQRLEAAEQEAASRHADVLADRLEELQDQAIARMEQQLHRVGTQVRQAFLRHIVTELARGQETWLQQARRQIEKLAAEQLKRTRKLLSEQMREFGELWIRQAAFALEDQPAEVAGVERPEQLPLTADHPIVPSETEF